MPVPASINDLSTVAGSNSPPGSESPAVIDEYLRSNASFIAQLRDGKQPLDAMLTALAALTSANGQFLAFTGSDTPEVRAIVGTVSQASSVPTGAIIERGSSAAGEYTKYADGTLICYRTGFGGLTTTTAVGSVYRSSSDVTWTFPVAFIATPVVSANAGVSRWCSCDAASLTTATIRQYGPVSSSTSVDMNAMAVGRWF